ncbi:MAG: hypothetical protein K8R68_09185 [Bacteroidales bacterium]|nr:hypothetical protein [Bacteroidales bacterium]
MKKKNDDSISRRTFINNLSKTIFYASLSGSIMSTLFTSCSKEDEGNWCYSTNDCDQYNCMNDFNCHSSLDFDCDDYFDCLSTFNCRGGGYDFVCHDYFYCSADFTCVVYDDFDCDDFTCIAPYNCNAPNGNHECSSWWSSYSHKGGGGG